MEDEVDDRYAGIDIDCLLNRNNNRHGFSYGRKKALYEAPEFLQRLNGEETLMEGQSLCLECKVQGFPVPTLRWFKDDEQIVDHPRIKIESNGHGGYALIIDNVNRGDEAAYRCRAENVEGACSSVFFLSVKAKPKNPKKDSQRSPNRRTVSFPPMFSTIVEKVEEEEKQGKEFEMLPPSPLTDSYYALTLKSRATWPAFLGDWAFKNDTTGSISSGDYTFSSDDDVFDDEDEENDEDLNPNLSNPVTRKALFYFNDDGDIDIDDDTEEIFHNSAKQENGRKRKEHDNKKSETFSDYKGSKIPTRDAKTEDTRRVTETDTSSDDDDETNNSNTLTPTCVNVITPTPNAQGDITPPIVVELWEDNSVFCSVDDNNSAFDISGISRFSREEREPTPFMPGPISKSQSARPPVAAANSTSSLLPLPQQHNHNQRNQQEHGATPRSERELTPFADFKPKEDPHDTQQRHTFYRELTPFSTDTPKKSPEPLKKSTEAHEKSKKPFKISTTPTPSSFGLRLEIPSTRPRDLVREPRDSTPFAKDVFDFTLAGTNTHLPVALPKTSVQDGVQKETLASKMVSPTQLNEDDLPIPLGNPKMPDIYPSSNSLKDGITKKKDSHIPIPLTKAPGVFLENSPLKIVAETAPLSTSALSSASNKHPISRPEKADNSIASVSNIRGPIGSSKVCIFDAGKTAANTANGSRREFSTSEKHDKDLDQDKTVRTGDVSQVLKSTDKLQSSLANQMETKQNLTTSQRKNDNTESFTYSVDDTDSNVATATSKPTAQTAVLNERSSPLSNNEEVDRSKSSQVNPASIDKTTTIEHTRAVLIQAEENDKASTNLEINLPRESLRIDNNITTANKTSNNENTLRRVMHENTEVPIIRNGSRTSHTLATVSNVVLTRLQNTTGTAYIKQTPPVIASRPPICTTYQPPFSSVQSPHHSASAPTAVPRSHGLPSKTGNIPNPSSSANKATLDSNQSGAVPDVGFTGHLKQGLIVFMSVLEWIVLPPLPPPPPPLVPSSFSSLPDCEEADSEQSSICYPEDRPECKKERSWGLKTLKKKKKKKSRGSSRDLDPKRGDKFYQTLSVKERILLCSPFGPYSLQALLVIPAITFVCLILQVPVGKFLCYVLACFYSFCVLRRIGIIY